MKSQYESREGVREGSGRVDQPPKILPDKGENFRFSPFLEIFINIRTPQKKIPNSLPGYDGQNQRVYLEKNCFTAVQF